MSEVSTLPPQNAQENARGAPESHWTRQVYYGLTGKVWARIGIVAALLITLFWPNLRRLFFKTAPFIGEPNWGHSFFVPLIGLYYLYLNREALLAPAPVTRQKHKSVTARGVAVWIMLQMIFVGALAMVWGYKPSAFEGQGSMIALGALAAFAAATSALCWWENAESMAERLWASSSTWLGFFLVIWGIWFYSWGIYPGSNDFFKDVAMVITLFGVVALLGSWRVMKTAWFPLAFLFCALPWPQLIYSKVALPLQEIAATAAVFTLKAFGMEAQRFGTKMFINDRPYDVAEACAGLKSLMTFISVAAAVAFLSVRPLWQKLLITASAVPIAIFCNMVRVTGIGLLSSWDQRWSESFAHMFVGLVLLIPAFFLIMLVGWILDNLFIEEADRKATAKKSVIEVQRPAARPAARAAAATASARTAAATATAPAKPAAQVGSHDPLAATNQDLAEATRRMMANQSRRTAPKATPQHAPQQTPQGRKPEGQ